jgi:DNA processing protein
MRITENALNILTAKSYLGIGKAWIIKNLSYQMPLDQLVRKINSGAKIQEPITIENFKQTRTEIHESPFN